MNFSLAAPLPVDIRNWTWKKANDFSISPEWIQLVSCTIIEAFGNKEKWRASLEGIGVDGAARRFVSEAPVKHATCFAGV